jgi:small-conductance mechanosensitive channel
MGAEETAVTARTGLFGDGNLLTSAASKHNNHNRRRPETLLNQRQRKAVGTVLTILSLVIWATIGMWIYDWFLVGVSPIWHLIFFVGFGLAWIFPARVVILWMAKPDA